MKKLIFIICILALAVVINIDRAEGQWTSIGPYGASITASGSYENKLFIATKDKGIFRSLDNGNTWEFVYLLPKNNCLNCPVQSILVNETYVFVLESWGGLFRSTNNGNTWSKLTNFGGEFIKSFNEILYLGNSWGKLYQSTNNGDNWTVIRDFSLINPDTYITDIALHNSYLFVSDAVGYIFRSSNGGVNWSLVLDSLGTLSFRNLVSSNSFLFTSEYYNKLLRTSDNGNTWEIANNGLTGVSTSSLKIFNSQLFITTTDGVFKSYDNGNNWINVSNGLLQTNVNNLFTGDGALFVGCTSQGIYKTTNYGNYWYETNTGFTGNRINSLTSNSEYLFVGTSYGEIYRSSDQGINWTSISNGIVTLYNIILFVKDSFIFCLTQNEGIFRSSDNGENWELINNDLPGSSFTCLAESNSDIFLGSYSKGIYVSTNNGGNWISKNNGFPNVIYPPSLPTIISIFSDGNNIYAGLYSPSLWGQNVRIYRSSNNGNNWILKNNGFEGELSSFSSNGNYIYAAGSRGIFRSSDNGDNWILHNNGFVNQNAYSVYASENSVLATNDSGFFYSDDNGLNWYQDNDGFKSNDIILQLHPYHGEVFAGLKSGSVWKSSTVLPVELLSFTSSVNENNVKLNWQTNKEINNSGFDIERSNVKDQWTKAGFIQGNGNSNEPKEYTFTDKNLAPGKYKYRLKQIDFNGSFEYYSLAGEVSIGIPDKYQLSQNYPNPFNPATVIRYSLTENSFTTLKIYDITGREMTRLVNEKQEAGRYEVIFNGSNLASGVYFYELRSGDFVAQKKMVILK